MLKKIPKFFVSIIILGYVFAFFSLFNPSQSGKIIGVVCFLVAVVLHFLLITSQEYKASRHLSKASKFIEKGNAEAAYGEILESAKLYQNEDTLYQLFQNKAKYKKTVGEVAGLISKNIKDHDTPYFRLIGGMMFYIAGNLNRSLDLLLKIKEDDLTIKMVRLIGSVFYDMKDYDNALEYLSIYDPPYTPMNEDEMAVVYGMGLCYLAKGIKDKAIEYLEKVEMRNGKFGNVSKILASIEEAEHPEESEEEK